MESLVNIHRKMFRATLSIVAKKWKDKYPSISVNINCDGHKKEHYIPVKINKMELYIY